MFVVTIFNRISQRTTRVHFGFVAHVVLFVKLSLEVVTDNRSTSQTF